MAVCDTNEVWLGTERNVDPVLIRKLTATLNRVCYGQVAQGENKSSHKYNTESARQRTRFDEGANPLFIGADIIIFGTVPTAGATTAAAATAAAVAITITPTTPIIPASADEVHVAKGGPAMGGTRSHKSKTEPTRRTV